MHKTDKSLEGQIRLSHDNNEMGFSMALFTIGIAIGSVSLLSAVNIPDKTSIYEVQYPSVRREENKSKDYNKCKTSV